MASTHHSLFVRYRRIGGGVAIALVMSLATAACVGSTSGSADTQAASSATSEQANAVAVSTDTELFDSSVVHAVTVDFDDADYDEMIEIYSDTGDKEWIEATVTIDGTTYEQVGIRLKGNSSLRGLSSEAGPGGGPGGDASADDPAGLPWLIRLDKYVDDQNHQGYSDLVIRSNNSETSLNEAVALELTELAGLASQPAMATSFVVNDSEPTLRLVIEHPDDVWVDETFATTGALYKAESTGDYSYRGDDEEAYDEVFDQEAGKDNEDLSPLIAFLDFINNSDDTTFTAEISEHLDVDSFATYLALQELLDNFDDIDGPGNNSYLFYDSETEMFTVVPWDMNLVFDGLSGGGGGPGGDDFDGGPPGGGGAGGGPGGQSNVLVERLMADSDFEALYAQKLDELRAELYDSGTAQGILDTWVSVLERDATDLVSSQTIAAEAATIATFWATSS